MTEQEIYAIIREAKERTGCSNLQLSKKAGISQQVASYILLGTRKPSLPALIAYCDALGLEFIVRPKTT
ncbi:MAG: helix-turn-helix transcriptional regulator [Porphyromonas sp.]|nr:helix-turn-helix transcriptional regulator [Porphyromonas sp.]